jgi:hypothetical protein
VLVWYARAHPLDSFQYQVYDVRKGEYTPAVDTWIALVRKEYLAFVLITRDVDLRYERGDTEALKVGSVVTRDLLAAAAIAGVVTNAGRSIGPGPRARESGLRTPLMPGRGPAGARGIDLNPSRMPFPVPYPYPRPHP